MHRGLWDDAVHWQDAADAADSGHYPEQEEIPVVCMRLFEMEFIDLCELRRYVVVKVEEDRDDQRRHDRDADVAAAQLVHLIDRLPRFCCWCFRSRFDPKPSGDALRQQFGAYH